MLVTLSGTNSITGVQTICQGGVPATLGNDRGSTADLASSTIVYQWQSRTGLNAFTDMPGATGQTLILLYYQLLQPLDVWLMLKLMELLVLLM